MHKKQKINYESGAAMIIVVIFFLFLSMTIVLGIATPILKQVRISNDLIYSKESYYLASGALEDALYRLKNGKNISSGDTVVLDGYTTTISLTTTMDGKTIETNSNRNGIVRKIESRVITGVGSAFNYGVQVGTGGFILKGGSRINGNVYSNGDIVATNGVVITGSAIAANSAALSADQSNENPVVPTNPINFRDTASTEDFAQSFQVNAASPINKISLYIKKVGNPSDAIVRIVTDSSGSPSSNNILSTQGTLSASLVGTSGFGWVDIVLPSNPELNPGTTYWIVLDNGSKNASNYYVIGANSAYTNGMAKIGKYGGVWNNTSPSGLDGYFKIYLGGLTSSIGGNTYSTGVYIGSAGIGDAWAHTVQGATVDGHLYCQTGSYNNKVCDTSRPDPSPQGYPVSDANIADWKSDATDGGTINGDYAVNASGATLGPKKITGNLTIAGGGTLTLTGTIWVQGTIYVSGGGKVKLSTSYGEKSGVLLSDGYINLEGGGLLTGSGFSGSYLLVLTTSNCPIDPSCSGNNALSVSGGAGAVVLNAQNGVMNLEGGMNAKGATAYQITATGGTTINYESGLADMNFSSGPSGGWNISSWKEIP
jgi:cytoskeletal protein CcmA (bactofilin family)